MPTSLIHFAGDDKHQEVVLKILYQLSYEDDVKHNFVECIGLVSYLLKILQGISNMSNFADN